MGIGRVVIQRNRAADRFLAELGGARSPEIVEPARALYSAIRKVLSRKGAAVQGPLRPGQETRKRLPSAPGDPPAKQTGRLAKSVRRGVVGTGQRVAVTAFYAPLLEFGVDTRRDRAQPRSRRDLFTGEAREVTRDSRKALARKVARRDRGSRKTRQVRIAARPFMQRALESVREAMVNVAVSEIRRQSPNL